MVRPGNGSTFISPSSELMSKFFMNASTIEVLDMTETQGRFNCSTDRYYTKDITLSSVVLSWNETSAREGFMAIGGGVAFVQSSEERILHKAVPAAPDELGKNKFAWRDTDHAGNMIVVVVLPTDYVVKELGDTHPPPVRFKIFNSRMAFYWDIGEKTTDITWRVAKRGNRNLDRLVAELNRATIAAKPEQHAEVVDKQSGAGAQPPAGHPNQYSYRPTTWEKITVAVLAGSIILAALFAALRSDEIPARNFTLLRILLSAAMGFMGGVIPGFLRVDLSLRGVLIRSGGGLALGVLTFFFTPSVVPKDPPKSQPVSEVQPQPAIPGLDGDLDVRINAADGKGRDYIGLDHPGALPLKSDDGYVIVATINRPAYAYIVLIKPDGVVKPVYPWTKPGDWKSRPQIELPLSPERSFTFQPLPGDGEWWYPPTGPAGMLTLMMLARDTPLPEGEDLATLIGPVRPQEEQHRKAKVWFRNGVIFKDRTRPDRDPDFEAKPGDDPVMDIQRRVKDLLLGQGKPFTYSLAVSFATEGRPLK